jgi:hypothetical protein
VRQVPAITACVCDDTGEDLRRRTMYDADRRFTKGRIMTEAEAMLERLAAEIRAYRDRLLDEAKHAKEVGTKDAQFAATAGAAVIPVVLGIVAKHRARHRAVGEPSADARKTSPSDAEIRRVLESDDKWLNKLVGGSEVSSTNRVGLLDPGIEPCEHKSVHDGPRVEVVYGTASTQVCDCGMWRMNLHIPGPWRTPPISSTEGK